MTHLATLNLTSFLINLAWIPMLSINTGITILEDFYVPECNRDAGSCWGYGLIYPWQEQTVEGPGKTEKTEDQEVKKGECGRPEAGSTVNGLELGTCIGHLGPFSPLLVLLRNPSSCFPTTNSLSVSHRLLTWSRMPPSKKPCLHVPCLPMFF